MNPNTQDGNIDEQQNSKVYNDENNIVIASGVDDSNQFSSPYHMSNTLKIILYSFLGGLVVSILITALPIFVFTGSDQGGAGWIIFLSFPMAVFSLLGLIAISLVYAFKKLGKRFQNEKMPSVESLGTKDLRLHRIFAWLCFSVGLVYFSTYTLIYVLSSLDSANVEDIQELLQALVLPVIGGLAFAGIIGSMAVNESSDVQVKAHINQLNILYLSVFWMLFLFMGPLYFWSLIEAGLFIT